MRRILCPLLVSLAFAQPLATAPGVAGAAECNGDECQGPPPAPEEVIPGTAIVEGPQNPPVRFTKPHPKKKHHPKKHRHRGKK